MTVPRVIMRIAIYAILILAALYFLLPLYVLLVTSFKSYTDVNLATMWNLPKSLSFESFRAAWLGSAETSTHGLSGNFWNSVKLVIPATILSTFIGSINGYILAKWKFKGSNFILPFLLFGMFIPYQSVLIPLVSLLQVWSRNVTGGWVQGLLSWQVPDIIKWLPPLIADYVPSYGTIGGLVLIHVIYGIPICTLIFRNYYVTIPDELVEAAKIDGGGFFGIYQKILLPISKPAFVVVMIWQFTSIWNEFLFASTLANTSSARTMTVALNNLAGSFVVEWNVQMAGALIAALPTLLIYILLSRYFMRGLLAGALKG
jgi:glucose/mannose transport system permease protein